MSEDDIESSAAPLVEHLIELRQRLIKALIAVAIVFVIAFIFADQIFQLLVIPYERAAGEGQKLKLIFTAPQEYFFAQLKIALFTAPFCCVPCNCLRKSTNLSLQACTRTNEVHFFPSFLRPLSCLSWVHLWSISSLCLWR